MLRRTNDNQFLYHNGITRWASKPTTSTALLDHNVEGFGVDVRHNDRVHCERLTEHGVKHWRGANQHTFVRTALHYDVSWNTHTRENLNLWSNQLRLHNDESVTLIDCTLERQDWMRHITRRVTYATLTIIVVYFKSDVTSDSMIQHILYALR